MKKCSKSEGQNGGYHLTITNPFNGNRVCLFCGELIK